MQIAMSKTREQFPLSTKKVLKKTIAGTLGLAIALLFLYFAAVFPLLLVFDKNSKGGGSAILFTLGVFILIFVIFAITYYYQKWYYATYFYELTSDYIQIKKGPITPKEVTIPYERIQDVYVDQDLLDRVFGIYDVHLSSATFSSGVAAHIDGVEKEAADGLRNILLQTIQKRITNNRTYKIPVPPGA